MIHSLSCSLLAYRQSDSFHGVRQSRLEHHGDFVENALTVGYHANELRDVHLLIDVHDDHVAHDDGRPFALPLL